MLVYWAGTVQETVTCLHYAKPDPDLLRCPDKKFHPITSEDMDNLADVCQSVCTAT